MPFSPDENEVKVFNRKINREISHAIEHFESGDEARKKLGLSLLKQALEENIKSRRDGDGNSLVYLVIFLAGIVVGIVLMGGY